ncbi:hypothetical protein PCASD_24248 [Puccinia coronata f. sp. avenae]|uniref:Uncharacterized protein n=1 Tax=Puccinia coronata f. sp. avenae TaxID=200324 RepID=A0A2N5THP2_9BASI|nr:hypothetical protein PCASD_24248 [Puccinia coronata f. sp. avenae]
MTSRAPSPTDSEMGGALPPLLPLSTPPPLQAWGAGPLPHTLRLLPHRAQPALPPPGLIDNESTSTILSKWVDDEFFVKLTHFLRKDQPSNKDVLLLLLSSMTQLEQRMANNRTQHPRPSAPIAPPPAPPKQKATAARCILHLPLQSQHPHNQYTHAPQPTNITALLPRVNMVITDDLAKCNLQHALPISVRLSKKGAIVITTAPRCEAASIKANIEALSTISTATNTLHEKAVCHANWLPTATAKCQRVRFLKSQQDHAASKSQGEFTSIIAEWDDEPLPVFAGMGLQQATTFQMLNRHCKAFRLHPTHRNKVVKNCCQFGHPTNTCIKDARCAYCGQNHHHSDHGKFCKASGVTYQPPSSPANTPLSSVVYATRRPTTTPLIPSALPT